MNYNQLKEAIIEVIRTNGNEEITGEVLQYVLLEMVAGLGEGYAFKGVATPATEPAETDANIFYIGAKGEYRNFFDAVVDVPEGSIVFFVWNGIWTARVLTVTKPTDAELVESSENPVAGGAVFSALQTLKNAGYMYAGIATSATEPPASPSAKLFYFALSAGEYEHFGNGLMVQAGLSIIRYDGSAWRLDTLFTYGGGLSEKNYTTSEKEKLLALPTAEQLAALLLGKQDILTFDIMPTEDSANPVRSGGVYEADRQIVGKFSEIAFTADKKVINVGEQANVSLSFASELEATSITIKRGSYVLATGTGRTLQTTSSENPTESGTITYQVEAVINGVMRTKEVTVTKEYPVMYGAGASASDISAKATPRQTPVGRYPVTVSEDGQHIFVLVPVSMSVAYVTLGGLELPMDAPTGTTIGSASYLVYRSSNTYVAGSYNINVY